MGKFVRNRIPALFCGASRTLDRNAYRAALRNKLQEEAAGYLESGEVLQLANVREARSVSDADGLRERKAAERGAFRDRLWSTLT